MQAKACSRERGFGLLNLAAHPRGGGDAALQGVDVGGAEGAEMQEPGCVRDEEGGEGIGQVEEGGVDGDREGGVRRVLGGGIGEVEEGGEDVGVVDQKEAFQEVVLRTR